MGPMSGHKQASIHSQIVSSVSAAMRVCFDRTSRRGGGEAKDEAGELRDGRQLFEWIFPLSEAKHTLQNEDRWALARTATTSPQRVS